MKLAIMQPYLFPYLGYWQMMNAVDRFVVYDDVNYIKGGWINRNYILSNGAPHLFTLSLDKASPFKKINETEIKPGPENRSKVLSFIRNAYMKAPYFKAVFPLLEDIFGQEENNLALFLFNHFRKVCGYIGIKTELLLSSDIEKDNSLRAQDKVIEINKKLNAAQYINAIGGQELYSRDDFAANGLRLSFIRMKPETYPQFGNEFVPNLSIIDVMMFNSPENIRRLLSSYELV